MKNNYELLIKKEIIQILDGDELLGDQNDDLFRMPYLKGTDLCSLSSTFGLFQEYGASRWTYLDNLLRYVISRGRCDELLRYMFDMERFVQLKKLHDPFEVEKKHREICEAAINRINSILSLGRHELRYIDKHFIIIESGNVIPFETPVIELIDFPYIQGLSERCKDDFISANYDSVITKSRTIIEEVLIYILERKNLSIEGKGDIGKLYNQVKILLHMQQDKSYDGRINSLLYGLERIVESIGAMRNANSDAHGVGSSRIQIKEREARLAMNSAIAFCEYILSVAEKT